MSIEASFEDRSVDIDISDLNLLQAPSVHCIMCIIA